MAMIEDAAARFSQGLQHLQAGNVEQAIQSFTESVAAFPQFEPAFRLRAEAYRSLGRQQEANADLESVISITQARLQEAEQSLGAGARTPQPAATGQGTVVPASAPPAPAQSPRPSAQRPGGPSPGLLQGIIGALGSVVAQSPIILWTLVGAVVLVIGAVVLLVLAGGQAGGTP